LRFGQTMVPALIYLGGAVTLLVLGGGAHSTVRFASRPVSATNGGEPAVPARTNASIGTKTSAARSSEPLAKPPTHPGSTCSSDGTGRLRRPGDSFTASRRSMISVH
jgi:hypothetical protein